MEYIIVTGMSGAGKSTVLKFLEDIDFFCVDNLPPTLLSKFAHICSQTQFKRIAMGIDIRGGKLFKELFDNLSELNDYKILFLDANDEVILNRFKETRRAHPLAKNERIITGIQKERSILAEAKHNADYIIDTSHMRTNELKQQLTDIFVGNKRFESLVVNVMSFGFKNGIPSDSDLVLDVRFIPNPFYIPELKKQTGNDKSVRDYVLNCEESKTFLSKANDLIDFLIPCYIKEGKNQLVISIGCTGGQHRSVVLATEISKALSNDLNVILTHRDIGGGK